MTVDTANNRLYIGIVPQVYGSGAVKDKVKFICDVVTSGSSPGNTGTYDIHTFTKLNTVPDNTIFSDLDAHGYLVAERYNLQPTGGALTLVADTLTKKPVYFDWSYELY
jgi:hypothetical protein